MSSSGCHLSQSFRLFDPLRHGSISEDQASHLLRGLMGIPDMTQEEVNATVKAMDVECSGLIPEVEFERMMHRKLGERSLQEDVWRSFLFLSKGQGRICARDIAQFSDDEQVLSGEEFRALYRVLTLNSRPVLYEQWKRALSGIGS